MLLAAYAESPPPITGNAAAPAWRRATCVQLDANTSARVLEDGDYLYVAFSVRQAGGVQATARANGASLGDDDRVTVYLADAGLQYAFSATPIGTHDATSNADPQYEPAWKAAGHVSNDGYNVTLRIPRSEVRGPDPRQWHIAFGRTIASSQQTITWRDDAFSDAQHPATIAHNAVFKTAPRSSISIPTSAVTIAQNYRQLWPMPKDNALSGLMPGGLAAPNLPQDQNGVAFATTDQDVTVAGVDAVGDDGRNDDAQSLAYVTPNGRMYAAMQRAQATGNGVADTTQWVSAGYDTGAGVSFVGGNASDRNAQTVDPTETGFSYYGIKVYNGKGWLAATWSAVGQQFAPQDTYATIAPGTQGYALQAQRNFGNAVLSGHVDRYHDRDGNLMQSDQGVTLSVPLDREFKVDVSGGSSFLDPDLTGPIAYDNGGVTLSYSGHGAEQSSISYQAGSYADGYLQQAGINATFQLPLHFGSLTLGRNQMNFLSDSFGQSFLSTNSIGYAQHIGNSQSAISLTFSQSAGAAPAVVPQAPTRTSSVFLGFTP